MTDYSVSPEVHKALTDMFVRLKKQGKSISYETTKEIIRPFVEPSSGATQLYSGALTYYDGEPELVIYGLDGDGDPGILFIPARGDHVHPLDPTVSGDLSGSLPSPIVAKINTVEITNLPSSLDQILIVTSLSPLQAAWSTPPVRKTNFTIGNGVLTTFTLTHNLNTQVASVSVIRNGSPYDHVFPDMQMVNVNQTVISFTTAPTTDQYKVVIIG